MGAQRRMIQDARISARREAPPRGLSPFASPSHPRATAWGTRRAAGATPAPQTCSFPSCGRPGRGDVAQAPSLQRHHPRLSWATEENGDLAIPADAPAPSPRQAGGGRDPSITLDNARVARGSCGRHGPHATARLPRSARGVPNSYLSPNSAAGASGYCSRSPAPPYSPTASEATMWSTMRAHRSAARRSKAG